MTLYPDLEGQGSLFHCVTCSDEALACTVLSVDEANGLAVVSIQSTTTQIDVSLVDAVLPGDVLLVHGGVALAHAGM